MQNETVAHFLFIVGGKIYAPILVYNFKHLYA